ncbi:MBL fold metallo-hydrolase [Ramlibacter sp. WS9]|uniref:MBL fold metallo-hydrolase n=1 Tax=Ramlibacter sp. WS9 TaxID=1882741 RepID=UPI0013050789|nr:MBL fold metallo-hydrolase [Ramlibacter sp. WS9]
MTWPHVLRTLTMAGAALSLLASCATPGNEAHAVLREADRAMGGTTLKSLRYAGSGTGASFGQAYQPGMAWPRVNITSFSRVIDYETGAMREDAARSRAETTGGSGLPLAGEQRATALVRGEHAWNLTGPAPVASPVALSGRTHDLWTSPHGVLKAGMRNATATLRTEGGKRIVSFNEPGRFSASAWITADGFVERIDSVQPNPVMGDTPTITLYSGYRDFAGVRFPSRIQQEQGGFPVLDIAVKEVEPNVPAGIEVPALVSSFAERVAPEKAAEGVWYLAGGSHHSVLIEMKDHLILVESPLYDGRAQAVLAEARKLVPGKPVRYAINSHHHFDHSGGLRAAAAEGATLVVSEQARPWYERTMARANSVSPDALAKSGAKVAVTGVNTQRTFSDGSRTVEVFMIEDSIHAQGFMMVWLPAERLLIEADAYTPGAPGAAPPAPPNANNVNLVQSIERLRLNVDRILPLHGRIVPASELYTATGRRP